MSEKWNIVTLGGDSADESANQLVGRLESKGVNPIRKATENEAPFVHVQGYRFSTGESIRRWIIDCLKSLDMLPEWAIVTHANTTKDGGRAWILRQHSGHMDIIDIALGHGSLFGEDIESYLRKSHGVEIPVWLPTVTEDDSISTASMGKAMTEIPESVLSQALDRYPMFDRIGTLSDPKSETQPSPPHSGNPLTEQRSVTLSNEEFAFYRTALRDYTSYDEQQFIRDNFDEGEFTGSWDEFKDVFWTPMDAVASELFDCDLTLDEEQELRGQANSIKWQTTINWHR